MSSKTVRLVLAAGLLVGACSASLPGTPLKIETASFQFIPGGCPLAGLAPFTIERAGQELRFVQDPNAEIKIIWPFGFAAQLVDGQAVLYASDGMIVGREGEVVTNVGGSGASGSGFYVCAIGVKTYR